MRTEKKIYLEEKKPKVLNCVKELFQIMILFQQDIKLNDNNYAYELLNYQLKINLSQ